MDPQKFRFLYQIILFLKPQCHFKLSQNLMQIHQIPKKKIEKYQLLDIAHTLRSLFIALKSPLSNQLS